MGLRFPAQIHGQCFFVTTTFYERQRLGNIPGMYGALADSLLYCARKYDTLIIGYVFMPSHIHVILYLDGERLASFMRDFKKYISQKAAKDLGLESPSIWMPRYDRVVITSENALLTKLKYVHDNPVKANLIDTPEKWQWSSASDYFGRSYGGMVPVFRDWV